MSSVWWVILLISGGFLLYMVLKPRMTMGILVRFGVNIVVAAAVIYIVQLFGAMSESQVPVNIPSVLIAGLLGLPGAVLLIGIHLFVLR